MDEQTQSVTNKDPFLKARHQIDTAKQALIQACEFYKKTLRENTELPVFQSGILREQIWKIEKMFGQHNIFLSSGGQDAFIYNQFFKGKKEGIYLEIGGHNGWRSSNCYFFEKTLGWQGVIVEASPTLVKEISKHRNARIIHAAVSDYDGVAPFVNVVEGFTQMGGLVEYSSERSLGHIRNHGKHIEQIIEVPTMTLNSLIDLTGLTHIDYCSIDTEGAERAILSGFDFSRCEISIFSVENSTCDLAFSFSDILIPAGYHFICAIGSDEIYIQESIYKQWQGSIGIDVAVDKNT